VNNFELKKFLYVTPSTQKMFIPNEIFEQMQSIVGNQKTFAYSYYYLITWLYRYTKYNENPYTQQDLKRILRYSIHTKEIDKIIKKNGLLEQLGLMKTISNYPIGTTYEDEILEFIYVNDEWYAKSLLRKRHTNRYTIKEPIQGLQRVDAETGEILEGFFVDIARTFSVPFDVFVFCMSHKDLGCTGFYLWSYIKYKNQIHQGGYDASLKRFSNELGLSQKTIQRYKDELIRHNMIRVQHNMDCFDPSTPKEDILAPTNYILSLENFSNVKLPIKKLKKKSNDDLTKNQILEIEMEMESLFS